MGSNGSRAPAEPAPPEAPTEAPTEWLTMLQDCSSCKVQLAIWEDYQYTGGSLHPPWSARLLLIPNQESGVVGSLMRRLWSDTPTTLKLQQLDPVVVASGPDRVERYRLERAIKEPYMHQSFRYGGFGSGLLHRDYAGCGTKERPWTLSGRIPAWNGEQLDLVPSNYHLTSTVYDTHNLVLEFEGGPMLLWRWAVKQLGFNEGVYELIWSMIRSSQGHGQVDDRWIYVFMSGYKFKGRLPGCAITHWSRD